MTQKTPSITGEHVKKALEGVDPAHCEAGDGRTTPASNLRFTMS